MDRVVTNHPHTVQCSLNLYRHAMRYKEADLVVDVFAFGFQLSTQFLNADPKQR